MLPHGKRTQTKTLTKYEWIDETRSHSHIEDREVAIIVVFTKRFIGKFPAQSRMQRQYNDWSFPTRITMVLQSPSILHRWKKNINTYTLQIHRMYTYRQIYLWLYQHIYDINAYRERERKKTYVFIFYMYVYIYN